MAKRINPTKHLGCTLKNGGCSLTWVLVLLIIATHTFLMYYFYRRKTVHEGFWKKIKKPVKKTVAQAEKKIVKGVNKSINTLSKGINEIPNMIKKVIFEEPVKIMPHKGMREYMYANVNYDKPLHIVALQSFAAVSTLSGQIILSIMLTVIVFFAMLYIIGGLVMSALAMPVKFIMNQWNKPINIPTDLSPDSFPVPVIQQSVPVIQQLVKQNNLK